MVRVGKRFNGPDGWANGGIACGIVGSSIPGPSTVRLEAPVPLDRPLLLRVEGGEATLLDDETSLASASQTPEPVPLVDAFGFERLDHLPEFDLSLNPFRTCFVCGDLREDGFGLRPRLSPDGRIGAIWDTTRTPVAKGRVPDRFVWAALDCPSGFAALGGIGPGVLGTQSVEMIRRPLVGERLLVVAESKSAEGRKHVSCASLYDRDGNLVARSQAIWLRVGVGISAGSSGVGEG
jgi:hypothetical protein